MNEPSPPVAYRPFFWICVVVGWAGIVVGVWGALAHSRATTPIQWSAWIVGLAIVHDGIIAPATLFAGRAIARRTSSRVRAWLQAMIAVTILVAAISLPAVLAVGRSASLPSLLPRNYAVGLAATIGVVWAAGILLLIWILRTRRGAAERAPVE